MANKTERSSDLLLVGHGSGQMPREISLLVVDNQKDFTNMLLVEFYQTTPYQDLENDNSIPKWGQSRKTSLTLMEINKIRRMNEVQAYERTVNLQKLRKQYAPPAEPTGM